MGNIVREQEEEREGKQANINATRHSTKHSGI